MDACCLRAAASFNNNINIFNADFAVHKLDLNKDSASGVYQLEAISEPTYFTQYIDKKGRKRFKTKPIDKIDDLDKVLNSAQYQTFAKSYLTYGEWRMPEPLGHKLEIIPLTDLSNLHPGDMIEVEVLFDGKLLKPSFKNLAYVSASSTTFGQGEKFRLMAYLAEDGKAQLRVPTAGLWEMSLYHIEDVTKDGPLKDVYGKAEQVYHAASLTFRVK